MNDKPKPDWLTPEVQEFIRQVEFDFHVREFGEEMARVNFLPPEERLEYIYDMIDYAVSKGVSFEKPALGVTR